MPVQPSTPQDTQAAIAVLVVIAACWSVAYWRTALKAAIIAALVLVAYGVAMGYHEVSALLATLSR